MSVLAPDGMPRRDFSLDRLMHAAYDSYLPWFARTVPVLVTAYDALPPDAPLKSRLNDQIVSCVDGTIAGERIRLQPR